MLQGVVGCCRVLQGAAECCSALQGALVCCSVLQLVPTATHQLQCTNCNTQPTAMYQPSAMHLQHTTTVGTTVGTLRADFSVMPARARCVAGWCSVLQGVLQSVAECCRVLQGASVCCNVKQCFSVLQCVAVGTMLADLSAIPAKRWCVAGCSRVLQGGEGCCRVFRSLTGSYSALQCIVVCCSGYIACRRVAECCRVL